MRFARHVLLPEIGEDGQARLEGARVELRGDAAAVAVARAYLERAGVTVAAGGRAVDVAPATAGRPELAAAAAFLGGAFAAVEVIKAEVGAGEPASLPSLPLTGPEDR